MIIFENLKIMYRDSVVFDMYLKSDRVVVHGNSATGKSFFCKTLLLLQRNKGVYPELPKGFTDINDLQKIEVFSAENMKKEKLLKVLKEIRYKLIIIDNADILVDPKTAEYISDDPYNQYLIFSRSNLDFQVYVEDFAEMVENEKNRVFYLKYYKIPGGFKSEW